MKYREGCDWADPIHQIRAENELRNDGIGLTNAQKVTFYFLAPLAIVRDVFPRLRNST